MILVKKIWNKWQSSAKIIGNFQTQVIFSVFYILILSIVGVIFRFFVDPLNIKNKKSPQIKKSNFQPWQHPQETIIQARRQF